MNKFKDFYLGCVNVPIYQASTIVFEKISDLRNASRKYGREGTETSDVLANEITRLEHGYKSIITPSGLSAITTSLLSLLSAGDHILLVESIYEPARIFATELLAKYDIEADFFPGDIGVEIAKYIKPNTKIIFMESPGSLVFEIQKVDEIVKIAKEQNIITVFDNTWSSCILFNPLKYGIDVSVISASKYISGHSDLLIGAITTATKEIYDRIWSGYYKLGVHTSPQDCYLALRGLRTLSVRMTKHQENTLAIAQFLEARKEVEQVLYPALPSSKSYTDFIKYFSGANSLLSFTFKDGYNLDQITKFVDSLRLFGIGFSWGGYESLVMLYENLPEYFAKRYKLPIVRLQIGLEDIADLKSDIEHAFAVMMER